MRVLALAAAAVTLTSVIAAPWSPFQKSEDGPVKTMDSWSWSDCGEWCAPWLCTRLNPTFFRILTDSVHLTLSRPSRRCGGDRVPHRVPRPTPAWSKLDNLRHGTRK